MTMNAVNPLTGEMIKAYEELALEEVGDIIENSQKAFFDWKKTSFGERAKLMQKAAEILRAHAEDHALAGRRL